MGRPTALLLIAIVATLVTGCRSRVLVLGLDGVEFDLLDILIEHGRVPHLAAIVEKGARAEFDCVPANPSLACYCPPVWMSIFTGQPAQKHRIFNFLDPSTSRRSPTLWDVNSANGGHSTVLSLHNTYPAERTVTFSVTENASLYFAGLLYELEDPVVSGPAFTDYDHITKPAGLFELLDFDEQDSLGTVWRPVGTDRVAFRMLSELTKRKRLDEWNNRVPELDILLFHSTDKSEHVTWRDIQPQPGDPIDEAEVLRLADLFTGLTYPPWPYQFGNSVSQLMEADYWIGELLESSDYDYLILLSDHGMEATMGADQVPGNHDVEGAFDAIFAMSGPGIVPGTDLGRVSIYDIAPTIAYLISAPIARDLPGRFLAEAFSTLALKSFPPRYEASWNKYLPY